MDFPMATCLLLSLLFGLSLAQMIKITPPGPDLVRKTGDGLSLTCEAEGLSDGEDPQLRWYDADDKQVTSSQGRKKVMLFQQSLSLILTGLIDGDQGYYNCSGTINGAPRTSMIQLKLYVPVSVNKSEAYQRPIINTDAKISCTPTGNPTPTVLWLFANETLIPKSERYIQEADGLIIKDITAADNGFYFCFIRGKPQGQLVQFKIKVEVTVPPTMNRKPSYTKPIVGSKFELSCDADGDPKPTFSFYKDGTHLTSQKYKIDRVNGLLKIDKLAENDGGDYVCKAENKGGDIQETIPITIIIPPKIADIVNVSEAADTAATLTCIARGDPLPETNWLRFGTETVLAPDPAANPPDSFKIVKESDETVTPKVSTIRLVFGALKPSDTGNYTCSATNEADTVKKTGQVVVEFKPHFTNTPYINTYGWANHDTSIECLVDGVPVAVVTWSHNGEKIKDEGNATFTVSKERGVRQIKSILKVAVNVANQEYIYGDYYCEAVNLHGSSSQIISLIKAEVPDQPSVAIDELNPTTMTLHITPPVNNGGQKVLDYKIVYNSQGGDDRKIEVAGVSHDPNEPRVKTKLSGLKADKVYVITVEARNMVGYSEPRQLSERTPTVRNPEKVVFKSDQGGKEADTYTVVWDTPLTGGSPLTRYTIKYARVEVDGSDPSSWTVKTILDAEKEINVDKGEITSYKLIDLEPKSFYQVTVIAINAIGSSPPASFIFQTRPREAATSAKEGGLTVGAIIGIIIAIIIIIFIVLDVTFYFTKKCGVLWFLQEKLAGKPSGEGDRTAVMEEGDSEKKEPLLAKDEAKADEGEEPHAASVKIEEEEPAMEEKEPEDKEDKPLVEESAEPPVEEGKEAESAPASSPTTETPEVQGEDKDPKA